MLLGILAYLPMDFRRIAIFSEEVVIHAVQIPLFLTGRAIGVIILVFDNLPFRKLIIGKQGSKEDSRRLALHLCSTFLLLWLSLFLLLGRYTPLLDTAR